MIYFNSFISLETHPFQRKYNELSLRLPKILVVLLSFPVGQKTHANCAQPLLTLLMEMVVATSCIHKVKLATFLISGLSISTKCKYVQPLACYTYVPFGSLTILYYVT